MAIRRAPRGRSGARGRRAGPSEWGALAAPAREVLADADRDRRRACACSTSAAAAASSARWPRAGRRGGRHRRRREHDRDRPPAGAGRRPARRPDGAAPLGGRHLRPRHRVQRAPVRRRLRRRARRGPRASPPWRRGRRLQLGTARAPRAAGRDAGAARRARRPLRDRRPGELERARPRRGPRARQAGEVDVPFEVPDRARSSARSSVDAVAGALERLGEAEVRRLLVEAAAPFRRPTAPTGSRTASAI